MGFVTIFRYAGHTVNEPTKSGIMKTLKYLSVLAAFAALISTTTLAANTAIRPSGISFSGNFISNSISFPEFARDNNIHGFVLAEYTIDEDGHAQITGINGSHPMLISYVKEQLNGISLPELPGTRKYIRFEFRRS